VHLPFGQQREDRSADVAAPAAAARPAPSAPPTAAATTGSEGPGTEAEAGAAGSETGSERAAALSADLFDEFGVTFAPAVSMATTVMQPVARPAGAEAALRTEAESAGRILGCEWGVHV